MQFGRYAYSTDGKTAAPIYWTRICETEDDALYLADDVLDLLPYDASPRIRAWPDCALRAWLNGAFLAAAFTPEEQALLLPVTLKTAASALLTVQPGLTAEDRIFLLDEREIGLYLRSPELRRTRLTPYAAAKKEFPDDPVWWWSRTGGATEYDGGLSHYVNGALAVPDDWDGRPLDCMDADVPNGVRPAFRMRKN